MTDDCYFEMSDKRIYLPKGRRVAMFPPVQHHDEEVFPHPRVFDPRRYLGEEGENLAKKNGR
jgi:cytochrome P450